MIVLEKALSKLYPEIDMVTTPTGKPVAMVHANNCTSDINAWVELFREFTDALGVELSQSQLFELLYKKALTGDADGGGLLSLQLFFGRVHHASWKRAVRCSSVPLRAVSHFQTSFVCICSRRLAP